MADKETAAALRQLPEGRDERNHHNRPFVANRPRGDAEHQASFKPFEEVEDSIEKAILGQSQKKALEELYSRTTIESPFIDDVSWIQDVPPCPMPKPRKDDAFAP